MLLNKYCFLKYIHYLCTCLRKTLIEPLWNSNKNKLPLTVNSSELWI
nr:MAG TPA: hypothetical protein [Caudoviricetes sp.]